MTEQVLYGKQAIAEQRNNRRKY